MAEKYTSEYFTNAGYKNIYIGAKCISLWSVHQFSGDYNPIHNHSSIHNTKLSFIVWTKVPEKMNNSTEDFLFNASGKEDGCTNFIGKASGNLLDFHPTNNRTYYPEVGKNLFSLMLHPLSFQVECQTVCLVQHCQSAATWLSVV